MRSALKRDLDANIFPQPGDASDASGEAVIQPAAAVRPPRPRIIAGERLPLNRVAAPSNEEAPAIVASGDALSGEAAPAREVSDKPESDAPTPSADALLGDLKRIMASLEAARTAEPATAVATDDQAADLAADPAPDGKPMGAVAAAALRAFRNAERTPRPAPGAGARLLAAEAERIAAERAEDGEGTQNAVEGSFAPARVAASSEIADPVLSQPEPADEPYVYASDPVAGAALRQAAADEQRHIEYIVAPRQAATRSAMAGTAKPAKAAAVDPDLPLLPTPALARDWLAVPQDEFAPPRYRAEAEAPRRPSKGFAFDVHAFVDELEREAAEAGRGWTTREGDALFARDRVSPEPATPEAHAGLTSADAAPTKRAPAVPADLLADDALTDPLPRIVVREALRTEPDETIESVLRAAEPEVVPSAPAVRRARSGRDTFTWKRLALLGVIVVVAGGGAIQLQSLAARNDGGEAVGTNDAAIASVAPHEQPVPPADSASATPVRVVGPSAAPEETGPVEAQPSSSSPALSDADAAAGIAPTLRPSDAAQTALRGPVEPLPADASGAPPVRDVDPGMGATPADLSAQDGIAAQDVVDGQGAADANSFPELAADRMSPAAEQVPAAPVQTETPAVEPPRVAAAEADAPASAAPAEEAQAPVPAPAPAPAPVPVAAARIPAPSGAAPSGSATVRSGVTMRAGADNKAAAIGTLKTGQQVQLVGCKLWCEVIADGKRGFVFNKFLATAQ